MLHRDIIIVCINLNIRKLFISPVQAEGGNAFRVRCCGNSVNNGIRAGIQPGTVNIQIIGIFFRMKIEYTANLFPVICPDDTDM